jgi:predicted NBD/HSP70 family sugar kinase
MDSSKRDSLIPETFLRKASAGALSDVERQLLSLIRIRAPIARPELARVTGLSLQTIVRVVASLMDRGLVVAGNKVITGRGQPSLPISLARDAAYAIGFSITADTLTGALIELGGSILARRRQSIDARNKIETLEAMRELAGELEREGGIDRKRLFGAGVSLSGFFRDGRINPPAGMEDWAVEGVELEIGQHIGLATWVENDGSAAAVGELLYGRGKDIRTFAYVYVGAGLGGGLVLDGRLWRGARGNAGELTGLIAPELRGERPTLKLLAGILAEQGLTWDSPEQMRANFDLSWPGVEAWLDRTAPATTALLSAIGAVIDPDAIIIGGDLPPALSQALVQRASFYTVPVRGVERQFPNVLVSAIGADAATLGAAALPFDRFFF